MICLINILLKGKNTRRALLRILSYRLINVAIYNFLSKNMRSSPRPPISERPFSGIPTLPTPFLSVALSAWSIFVLMCIFYDVNLYLESLSICTSHFLTWLQRSFLHIPLALRASSVSSRQVYSGDKWTNAESMRNDGKKSSRIFFFKSFKLNTVFGVGLILCSLHSCELWHLK